MEIADHRAPHAFTVPDAPSGLTATPGDSAAVLSWKTPSCDGFLGAAKVFHLVGGRLDSCVGESVMVRRYERNGWVTIGSARTDRGGHVRLTFRIGQTVGLRLVDAGTATVIGRQTAPSIV